MVSEIVNERYWVYEGSIVVDTGVEPQECAESSRWGHVEDVCNWLNSGALMRTAVTWVSRDMMAPRFRLSTANVDGWINDFDMNRRLPISDVAARFVDSLKQDPSLADEYQWEAK